MRTNLSNVTREEFNARVKEIEAAHKANRPPAPYKAPPLKRITPEQQTEAVELGKSLGWTIEQVSKNARTITIYIDRWIAEGRPIRTDEEIDEAMEFCEPGGIRPCEKHKNGKCTCGGCSAIMRKMPIRQAAKMGTVGCPAMKW